ncbi:MAG: Hsp20/alpha crystallin family protein [Candidatus Gracilibacteria bacterium]|nr:Hsp20/alpha crystallin family protein [Candidatus Gracilibacteria bacterium]
MFKLFGLGNDDSEQEFKDGIEVEVSNEDENKDDDVGQVALDIIEAEDEIIIIAPIAGVRLENIDLSLNKTVLTIKGRREKPEEFFIENGILRNSECFWGEFVRNVILPENLAMNKIKAYMQENVLVINIPKLKFDSKNIKIDRIDS